MILLLATALADCPAPTSPSDLGRAQTEAMEAFNQANLPGLESAVYKAREKLPCVKHRLTTSDLGAFYRTQALSTFVGRDRTATLNWLLASRAAEPDHTMSDIQLSSTHPFRRLYESIENEAPPLPIELPEHVGWVVVDGRRATHVPTTRPYVMQQFGVDGQVLATYLVPKGPPPALATPIKETLPPRPPRQLSSSLLGLGIGGGWIPGATSGYIVLKPHLRLGVSERVHLDVAAPVGWTRNEQWFVVPAARVGITYAPVVGTTSVWAGAAVRGAFFDPKGGVGQRVVPGMVGLFGLSKELGSIAVVVDGSAGWAGRPIAGATMGISLAL